MHIKKIMYVVPNNVHNISLPISPNGVNTAAGTFSVLGGLLYMKEMIYETDKTSVHILGLLYYSVQHC